MIKNINFLSVMLFSSIILSSYQLPLVENTLNKYGYYNNINEAITFPTYFQQLVENQKISFSSFISGENATSNHNSDVVNSNNIASISVSNNDIVSHNASINTEQTINHTPNVEQSITPINKSSRCNDNCVVLMIGDSVMGDVDFSVQRLLKKDYPSWKVIDGHKVSSGLTNQTYYNWPETAKKLVEKYQPDYIFVLLGTNDAQGMMYNGKALAFNKELWVNEYKNRVNQITSIAKLTKSSWYWIGLPVTKDKGFNSRLQVIRDIQSQQTKDNYIPVESIFGKNDHSDSINMKLRAPDGIHLNSSGADLVAKQLLLKLKG